MAQVREGREELVQKVAVCRVQLDTVEARKPRAPRGTAKRIHHARYVRTGHDARLRLSHLRARAVHAAGRERHLAYHLRTCRASGMAELHKHRGVALVEHAGLKPQAAEVVVAADGRLPGRGLAVRRHKVVAALNKAQEPALRALAVVVQQPLADASVRVRAAACHGRHHHAVAQLHAPHPHGVERRHASVPAPAAAGAATLLSAAFEGTISSGWSKLTMSRSSSRM